MKLDEALPAQVVPGQALAGQLPQSEQLWVEGRFRESTHEWDKAIDVYRTLLGFYPDDLEYALRLAAVQTSAGRGADARATIAGMRKLPLPASTDPDRKSTRLNSSHRSLSRMPSSA